MRDSFKSQLVVMLLPQIVADGGGAACVCAVSCAVAAALLIWRRLFVRPRAGATRGGKVCGLGEPNEKRAKFEKLGPAACVREFARRRDNEYSYDWRRSGVVVAPVVGAATTLVGPRCGALGAIRAPALGLAKGDCRPRET